MDSLALEHIARMHTTVLEMFLDRGYDIESLKKQMGLTPEELGQLVNNEPTNLRPLWFDLTKDGVLILVIYSIAPWADVAGTMRQYLQQEGAKKCLFIYCGGPGVTCKAEVRYLDNVEVEIADFSRFLINPTKHYLVPKHTILSPTEKARIMTELRVTEAQIPLIGIKDPIMQWYDAKPGDLIRITRTSNSTGRYVYYRLCC